MNKDEAKQKVAELVKKYEALSQAEIKSFHEAKTKQGFIEPLFRALGWNFEDTNEVTPEEKASNGRVDYAFKLNTVSQFYLEAKPLKADLTNETYIKQAITYAYNKGVTWAILTDFETLIVYVAQTSKPFITLTCNKYIDAFDDLWLLSKESFINNALGEKAERYGALPQRMGIEQRLFNQLKAWREELSTQLHSYEKKLSIKQIDEVIQRLFNRLIFIRTCEDRKIEEKVLLSTVHEWVRNKRKVELIEKLREIFRYFDGYYDSELFQKHITDEIFIESDTLERLINGLYEVKGGVANYDFSIIDADVLGAVYEQYLGYIANIVKERAKAAQAKMNLGLPYDEIIELTEKKQRRKEHGIYYTPKFITDYIVKETVGRFLAEHAVNEIRNIKILDPACGSGSFLIRAFDELLKYYANQKVSKSEIDIDAADRMSILQSNIYGVDLDIQAVEIARLNLLLRSLAKRETLPGLKDNIKEGNSLISGTEEELKKYFGNSWKEKKAFNWEEEFKEIMDNGGFDVVIGNPPYVTEQLENDEREFFKREYVTTTLGKLNTYRLFIDKSIQLLQENGLLGFIVPFTFLTNRDSAALRKMVLEKCNIISIITFPEKASLFQSVTQATTVLIFQKSPSHKQDSLISYLTNITESSQLTNKKMVINQSIFNKTPENIFILPNNIKALKLIRKIENAGTRLETFAQVFQGEVNLTNYATWISDSKKSKKYFPLIRGNDIKRYWVDVSTKKTKGGWVKGDKVSRNHSIFPRLVTQEVSNIQQERRLKVALLLKGYYCGHTTNYIIVNEKIIKWKYLLGLLNSKLLNYYFKTFNSTNHLPAREIERLPIYYIDINIPTIKKKHDTLVSLVDKMLELNKKYEPIRDTPFSESEELKKEIEKTDREIDNLVYDLYGLTEEERKIVEGTDSSPSRSLP